MPVAITRPCSVSNRRRYSRRNKALSVLMLGCLCAAIFLTCCAPSIPTNPPRARIVPATSQPSAVPTMEEARRISNEADRHGATAADRVGSTKTGLGQSHAEMQSLVGEVGRLRRQKAASENELLALYNRLVEQEKKTSILIQDITDAEVALGKEKNLRAQVSAKLVDAENLIHAKDAEATQLRSQLAHSESVADAYSAQADKNAKVAADNADRASRAAGTITTLTRILIGVSILCAISILVNIIQFRGRLPI